MLKGEKNLPSKVTKTKISKKKINSRKLVVLMNVSLYVPFSVSRVFLRM